MALMLNSRLSDDWLTKHVAANPFKLQENGNFTTCPVRLSFVHLLKPDPNAKNDDGTPKSTPTYECTALCPPGAREQINAVLWPAVYEIMRTKFPQNIDKTTQQPFGLHNPLARDQGEARQYTGYTPGLPFLRFTTQYKPPIVDTAMNPIVDEGRVYAGVWAILHFNMYAFGDTKKLPKKGVSLGLQAVMLVADDEKLAGGAPDPKTAFAGVSITGNFDAGAAFGAPPGVPAPPGAIMPPPAPAPQDDAAILAAMGL